ncbi:hypothetical protein DP113_00980 [Brasilonema octagenarum UFV-E1]|uniref:hypothetical protein n=1 Tax=Brasilonema TaxID=383614 RepID=UPI00145C9565|nr:MULTISPECIES: hypothetical protein [Brasilonema]QDL13042.1 hypothetical protein DP113_00980 [Brasilonema octagenarum UFV-E1]
MHSTSVHLSDNLSLPAFELNRTVLPTHLGYLKNALKSKQKHRANQESTYLVGAIPTIRETESISKDWGKDLEIGLDKVQHWIKKNL